MNGNLEKILAVTTWKVSVFNNGAHLRINGVIDVWPARRRWMRTNSRTKSEHYADIPQLQKIVRQAEAVMVSAIIRQRDFEALPRRAVKEVMNREEFLKRFG